MTEVWGVSVAGLEPEGAASCLPAGQGVEKRLLTKRLGLHVPPCSDQNGETAPSQACTRPTTVESPLCIPVTIASPVLPRPQQASCTAWRRGAARGGRGQEGPDLRGGGLCRRSSPLAVAHVAG